VAGEAVVREANYCERESPFDLLSDTQGCEFQLEQRASELLADPKIFKFVFVTPSSPMMKKGYF